MRQPDQLLIYRLEGVLLEANTAETFWQRVDVRGPEECWPWKLRLAPETGYGVVAWEGKNCGAHRIAYQLTYGPIPEGLVIDHVRKRGCVRRDCVNPGHLEAVTCGENIRRGDTGKRNRDKTICIHGHPYTEENTYHSSDGSRSCATCRRQAEDRRAYRKSNAVCPVCKEAFYRHPSQVTCSMACRARRRELCQ